MKGYISIILIIIILISSCAVETKNKRRTVAILKCYDKELFDFRKKYNNQEKKIERRNKRFIRKSNIK